MINNYVCCLQITSNQTKTGKLWLFYPRDAMLARLLPIAQCLSVSVRLCLSVCLSEVGVLSKLIDRSSWFWHRCIFSILTYHTLCFAELQLYLQRYGYTSLRNFVLNSGLRPKYISARHGDRRNLFSAKLDNSGRSERDKLDLSLHTRACRFHLTGRS